MKPQLNYRRPPTRRGLGMAEVVVATLIVGVMVVAALNGLGMIVKTQRLNADRLTGPGLARDLMAEIMSMPYADPQTPGAALGLDAGESNASRTTYDDIDDYHGLSSADTKAKDGTSRSGFTGWSQAVTVTWAERIGGTAWGAYDTELKRITVTAVSPAGVTSQLIALRSKSGALEQSTPLAMATSSWLGVELRVGTSTRSQFMAAPLTNLAPDTN